MILHFSQRLLTDAPTFTTVLLPADEYNTVIRRSGLTPDILPGHRRATFRLRNACCRHLRLNGQPPSNALESSLHSWAQVAPETWRPALPIAPERRDVSVLIAYL